MLKRKPPLATTGIARLFTCDSHNIVDWAFQVLRTEVELPPETCADVEYDYDKTLELFREYGMGPVIDQLLTRNATAKALSPAELKEAVSYMEMCTCEHQRCNNAKALDSWTNIHLEEPVEPPVEDGAAASTRSLFSLMVVALVALIMH